MNFLNHQQFLAFLRFQEQLQTHAILIDKSGFTVFKDNAPLLIPYRTVDNDEFLS